MIVLVIGAGAVGSFLGGTLAAAGHDVTLLRRRVAGTRVEALTLRGPGRTERVVTVSSAGSAADVRASPDLIVLAVKMPDVADAIGIAARWPGATILAVQNGVGADDRVAEGRRGGGIIAGSLTASVALEDGSIRRLSRGGIGLSAVRPVGAQLDLLGAAFTRGGLVARRYPDARAMRWSKLLANLLGNATSAILDMDPGEVYGDAALFVLEVRQLREALGVMHSLGLRAVRLPAADVRLLALAARLPARLVRPILARVVAGGRGGKSPSLRASVAAGALVTEVQWLNGAVARTALAAGRRALINDGLARLVSECAADADRRAWFHHRPDRLLEALGTLPD